MLESELTKDDKIDIGILGQICHVFEGGKWWFISEEGALTDCQSMRSSQSISYQTEHAS
jgi:hypothetical protein